MEQRINENMKENRDTENNIYKQKKIYLLQLLNYKEYPKN